jgi:hypothetical protein
MSTVSPQASRDLAQRVRERGAAMLDAQVSGSVPQVQTGTLTIMVGGEEDAYARVEPILRELGTPTYIGENGQGLVLKLAINISLAVQMLAFAEGLLLAERAGVDRRRAVEVMTQSPIGSPMLKARADLVLDLPDEAWFDIGLMQKDIVLALDTARQLRVPLPTAATADEMLTLARAAGYEHRDIVSPAVQNHVRAPRVAGRRSRTEPSPDCLRDPQFSRPAMSTATCTGLGTHPARCVPSRKHHHVACHRPGWRLCSSSNGRRSRRGCSRHVPRSRER